MSTRLKQTFNLAIIFFSLSHLFTLSKLAIASSCCTGGGGQTICVLPYEQHFQLGFTSSYRENLGQFDSYGYYKPKPTGTSSSLITTNLGAAYRLSEAWQAGLTFPFIYRKELFSQKGDSSISIGDPVVESRYTLWEDLRFLTFRPQLTFYEGVRLPLGTSIYNSKNPYGLDAVGEGTPTTHLGFFASKLYRPLKFSVDGSYFYPFSKKVTKIKSVSLLTPYEFKLGNKIQLLENVSYLFNQSWSTSVGFKHVWQFKTKMDRQSIEGSATRLFSSLVTLNYFYDTSFGPIGLGLTYETVFPFYRYLANQANYRAVSITSVIGAF